MHHQPMVNPLMSSGMNMVNGNSINSINSIFLGGMEHQNGGTAHNSLQNSGMIQGNSLLNKSNTSSCASNRAPLSFADKLKIADDK